MKEIIITTERQKTELIILMASFIGAIGLNIFGIIKYQTAWKELYSQWFTLLVLTVVIYFIVLFFRLLFFMIIRPLRRKKIGKLRRYKSSIT